VEITTEYRMSFSTGGLFLNESVELARIHEPGEPWEETQARAVAKGATKLPKGASNIRSVREIKNRISTFSEGELVFFLDEADRVDQQAMLWIACCRAYRFVREFAVEVIQDRFLSYQLDLPLESFDVFFDAKAEWNEDLANLSQSTRLKLRQILFRMMREADILTAQNQIQTSLLSTRLSALIEANNMAELAYFPGLAPDEV
jgi:BrxA